MLAGTEETVSQFYALLPRAWQDKVAGTIPMDINAADIDVLSKSWGVVEEALAGEQAALTELVVTSAAKGEGAVVGLSATLAALQEERAHMLVMAEGFSAPGYRCTRCGYIGAVHEDVCPYCGCNMVEVKDAVEYAVKRMLSMGGQVESVPENSELSKVGSISALLRY